MTPRLLALPVALMLAACGPTAPTGDATASADAAPAASEAPAAEAPATGTSAAATPGAGARTEADQAVDASIERVLGDPAPYRDVVERLQAAVASDDAAAVAALVRYPIQVQIDGTPTTLDNEQAFIGRYGDFMTPAIRNAIVGTRYADLFVNQDGVMLGDGQAWISGTCQDDACDDVDVRVVTLQPGAN